MAMTASVKDELSRVDVPKPCCRRAEMAALLRFAGGLHIVSGRVVVEAELDTGAAARRLRREIAEVYGYPSEFHVLASGGLRKGSHYIVRVVKDGEALARQTGLLDVRGRPVRGLPPHVVVGEHLLRGRRLAGRVPGPRLADRAGPVLRAGDHLPRPGVGAGAGRRGPAASASPPRPARSAASTGSWSRTATRSPRCSPASARTPACCPGRSGGSAARCAPPPTGWPTSTTRTCAARPAPRSPPRPGSPGRWRSSATTRPWHLTSAGRLRLEHRQASLEELGALADPPLTKDAIAGRIRRLLALADKRARDLGIPDTESVVTAEMLGQLSQRVTRPAPDPQL